MGALGAGTTIKIYNLDLRVCVTPDDRPDCSECQIHHLCNRDNRPLKEIARQFGEDGCMGLIGKRRHFKILQ